MSYRTQVKIIADVLSAANMHYEDDGAGVTEILRKANLSYSRLVKMLKDLVSVGLLNETTNGKVIKYKLSNKGQEFLEIYGKFEAVACSFGLRL